MKKFLLNMLFVAAFLLPWATQAQSFNYSCGFENGSDVTEWQFVNSSHVNKWCIDTAAAYSGSKSLYISNDNGITNAYTTTGVCVVYAYREVSLDAGTYEVSYDWRGYGEGNYDYLRVFLAPSTATLTAGTLPDGTTSMYSFTSTVPAGWIALDGAAKKNLSNAWQNFYTDVVAVPTTGDYKIVFMWANDGSTGTNPPAAVDNFYIGIPTCPSVTALSVVGKTSTTVDLSWTEMGTASQWLLYLASEGLPTQEIPCSSTTTTVTGLVPHTSYTAYVRANCGAGDTSRVGSNISFTTLYECPASITYNVDAASATSAFLSWSYSTTASEFFPSSFDVTCTDETTGTTQSFTGITEHNLAINGLTADNWYNAVIIPTCNGSQMLPDTVRFHTRALPCLEPDTTVVVNDTINAPSVSAQNGAPINNFYNYSFSEQLFLSNELSHAGLLRSISFEYAHTAAMTAKTSCQIYVGETTLTSLSPSSFVPLSDLTLVYTGAMNCTTGWNEFVFDTAYNYSGNNLVVAVVDNSGDYDNSSYTFASHGTSEKALVWQDDNNPYSANVSLSTKSNRSNIAFKLYGCSQTLPCTAPIAVVDSVTSESITISWAPGNIETSWIVEYKLTTSNTWIEESSSTYNTTATLTNLLANTEYNIRVTAICGDDDKCATLTTKTACGLFTVLPFVQDFERETIGTSSTAGSPFIPCWERLDNGTSTHYPYLSTSSSYNHTAGGSKALYLFNSVSSGVYGDHHCVVLPGVDDDIYNVSDLQLRFWVKGTNTSTTGDLVVGVLTAPTDFSTFVPVDTVTFSGSTWQMLEAPLSNYSGDGKYIGICAYMPTVSWTAYIDDITLMEIPSCLRPINVAAATIGTDEVTLTWNTLGSGDTWVVEYDTVPFTPATGLGNIATATDSTITITGLDSSTTYYFYVYTDCGSDISEIVSLSARTLVGAPATIPYTFDFSTSIGWEFRNGTQTNAWYIGDGSLFVSGDGGVTNVYSTNATSSSYAYRTFNLVDTGNYICNFNWTAQGEDNYDYLRVFLVPASETIEAGTFPNGVTTAYSFHEASVPNWIPLDGGNDLCMQGSMQTQTVEFPLTQSGTYNLVFVWANDGSGGINPPAKIDNLYFDLLVCSNPSNLVGSTNGDTVVLTWTEPVGSNTYDVVYGITGTDPDNMTNTFTATGATYTITGIPAGTIYDFYIRTNCGSEQGIWIGPYTALVGGTTHIMAATGVDTVYTCAGTIYDAGGENGDYAPSSNSTLYVLPATAGNTVTLSGTLTTESCCDSLVIYDGMGASAVRLAAYKGEGLVVGPFVSEQGSFTLRFTSDASVQKAGYELLVGCIPMSDCPRVTNIALTGIDSNMIAITWTEMGTATSWNIEYGTRDFTPGTGTTVVATTTDYTFTGLTTNTYYDFYVTPACGAVSRKATFRTANTYLSLPFACNFEDATAYDNWTLQNGTNTNKWYIGSAVNNGGANSLYITNDDGTSHAYTTSSATATDYAFVDVMIPAAGDYAYSYDWIANGESTFDYLRVALVPSTVDLVGGTSSPTGFNSSDLPASWISLDGSHKLNLVDTWQNVSSDITINTPGVYHLVFAWRNDGSSGNNPPAAVDNVQFAVLSCPKPQNITCSNLTQTSTTISWNEMGSATTWQYQFATEPIVTTTDTTCNLTGLTANTPYTFRVRAICGAGDTSFWAVSTFRTPCGFITLPYTMDFENETMGSNTTGSAFIPCWTRLNNGTNYGGYPYVSNSYNHSPNGAQALYWYMSSGTSATYGDYAVAVLPPVDTTVNALQLTFWVKSTNICDFQVGVMTDPNNVATFVGVDSIVVSGNDWIEYEIPLSNYTGAGQYVAIKTDRPQASWGAYVDDITLDRIPDCPRPRDLYAQVVGTTADLSWDGTATSYEVEYGAPEFVAGSGVTTIVTTNNALISGLTTETTYEVAVRAICGNEVSPWSNRYTFTTGVCDNPSMATNVHRSSATSTSEYLPGYSFYNYSISETIIDAADMAGVSDIAGFGFKTLSADGGSQFNNCQVYMANTTKSTFDDGDDWVEVDYSNFTMVYNGSLNYTTAGWQYFDFDSIFTWDGTSNVIIVVDRNNGSYASGSLFATVNTTGYKSLYYYSDNENVDPFNISISDYPTAIARQPQYQFYNCEGACPTPAITAENHDYGNITLTWTGAGNDYEVAVKPATVGAWPTAIAVSAHTYTFAGLNAAATYNVRVRQNCGDGELSNWAERTITTDSLPCFAPSDLTINGVGFDNVRLSWTPGSNENQWVVRVWRSDVEVFDTVNAYPATVNGLYAGMTYQAAVQAMCGNGAEYSDWSEPVTFTTEVCQPVSNVAATNVTATSAQISWTAAAGTNAWQVNYGDMDFTQGQGTLVDAANPYTINGLESDSYYDVYVRTSCTATLFSDWSSKVTFKTLPMGINDVEAQHVSLYPNPTSGNVTVAWDENDGAWNIDVIDLQGRVVKSVSNINAATAQLNDLTTGTYFVRIYSASLSTVKKLIVR